MCEKILNISASRRLFLQQILDHLSAVPPEVWKDERDMYPVRAGLGILFPNELVKGQVILDILEPLAALLQVAVDAEVYGLPFQVLRIAHAANGLVQSLTAEAATYLDGLVHRYP